MTEAIETHPKTREIEDRLTQLWARFVLLEHALVAVLSRLSNVDGGDHQFFEDFDSLVRLGLLRQEGRSVDDPEAFQRHLREGCDSLLGQLYEALRRK